MNRHNQPAMYDLHAAITSATLCLGLGLVACGGQAQPQPKAGAAASTDASPGANASPSPNTTASPDAQPSPEAQPAGDDTPRTSCDLPALVELGKQLDLLEPLARAQTIWPALERACGSALPDAARFYFGGALDPTKLEAQKMVSMADIGAFKLRGCPEWDIVAQTLVSTPSDMRALLAYESCNIGRFEGFGDAELVGRTPATMVWSMHQLLLDQGLAPAQAVPLTRALFTLEQLGTGPLRPRSDVRLPQAEGVPITHGLPIYVTPDAIELDEQRLVTLEAGKLAASTNPRIIGPVFAALEVEAETFKPDVPPLLIAADAETPARTLLLLSSTARTAGFVEQALVIEPGRDGYRQVRVQAPGYVDEAMSIELTLAGATIVRGQQREPAELDGIRDAARALVASRPGATVRIAVVGELPLSTLLPTLVAVQGPACTAATTGCLHVELLLLE